MKLNVIFSAGIIAGVAAITLFGCAQGPVARKKMPGYLNAESFESVYPFKTKQNRANEFSFATTDEQILFDGDVQQFVSVSLSDAAFDLVAADIIDRYKASAPALIAAWMKQGNQGVVLDFRSSVSQPANSATYRVARAGEFSLPVIIRWDVNSAARADIFMALMQNMPDINCQKVAN